jgi:hypothetical protein
MALHYNTLGGGAARSGTAAPGRSEEINVCSGCGFLATTEVEGRNGGLYPMCGSCEFVYREQEEEIAWCQECDQALASNYTGLCDGCHFPEPCEDCRVMPATTRFLHLSNGAYHLCDECFIAADHEDDYLEVCTCWHPVHIKEEDSLRCEECMRTIKAPMHCQCPVVATAADYPNHCLLCAGAVIPLTEQEGDRRC